MIKLKKANSLLVVFVLCFSLAACASSNTPASSAAQASGTEPAVDAQVYTMVFSHANSKDTSVHDLTAQAIKEYVERESGGRLLIDIYSDGQLGLDREVIEAVQAGTITMMGCSSAVQANFVPSAAIFDCPFSVNNLKAADMMVTDARLLSMLGEEFQKAGLKHLFLINGWFRNTSSSHEITKPEDFKGFKIRTMESPFHLALWRALGANPTPLAASELYTSLQQGVVSGQENAYDIACYYSVYEVNKYFSEDCHILAINSYIMNQAFYDGLPEDLKKVIDGAVQIGYEAGTKASNDLNETYRQKVLDEGCQIYTWPASDIAVLKEMTSGVWDMVRDSDGMNPDVFQTYVDACDRANTANP